MSLDLAAVESALKAAPQAAPAPQAFSPEQKRVLSQAGQTRAGRGRGDIVNRALAAVNEERNLEGARLAMEAVKAFPDSMPAYLAGAVALDRLGYLVEALAFYEQALKFSPNDVTICSLLGGTAQQAKQLEIAARCYRFCAQQEPENPAHVCNLGGVLRDMGSFSEAVEVLRNQIYVTADNPALWNTLGTVLQEQGDPEQAVTFFNEATRLKPSFARAYHNLGTCLTDLGRFHESGEALDHAIENAGLPSDREEMRHARALARLGEGRMEDGWTDYEARFSPLTHDYLKFEAPCPRWNGADLNGKHLMVLGEQGLGDEVLFLNAAADAIKAVGSAGKVTIACEKRLVPLVARSFPEARVIAHFSGRHLEKQVRLVRPASEWDGVDLWTPMGDLARVFRRSVSAFPATQGFMRADPERVAALRAQLAGAPGLKIGILWKSLVMTPKRQRYFAQFSAWAPLLKAANTSIFTLQYGDTGAEEAHAREKLGVDLRRIEGLDLKDDLEGVAAAGQALDLIIGPMNATTNLAAACGGAVWIFHRYGSWTMHGADDSPYYPSSRAFRAPDGDWKKMFEAMAAALEDHAQTRASAA